MRRIISSSEDAVVVMTENIKNMKVTDVKGENVTEVTGQLKVAIVCLEVLQKNPDDLEKNLLAIFQTTSVVEFNSYFKQLSISLRQITFFTMPPSQLLDSANTQYRAIVQIETWVSTTSSRNTGAATFKVKQNTEPLGHCCCNRYNKVHFGPCEKPHWKRVAPTKNESEMKKIKGKNWHHYKYCDR